MLDHCHDTGQVRGYLCRSCNAVEANSTSILWTRYRAAHPAAILDYYEPYTGYDWSQGWHIWDVGSRIEELGPRPSTPWPAFEIPVPELTGVHGPTYSPAGPLLPQSRPEVAFPQPGRPGP